MIIIKSAERRKWNGFSGVEFPAQGIIPQAHVIGNKFILGCTDKELDEVKTALGLKFEMIFTPNTGDDHPLLDYQYLPLIEDGTTMFETTDPVQRLKAYIAMGQPFVAKNKEEADAQPHIYTHYVFSEVEDVEKAASTFDKKEKAFEAKKEMSEDTLVNIIAVITQKRIKKSEPGLISAELDMIFNKNLDEFLLLAAKSPKELEIRSTIVSAINLHVIAYDKGVHQFKFGDFEVGRSLDEVVSYFTAEKDLLNSLEVKIGGTIEYKSDARQAPAKDGEPSEQ
jgi:hypothetical protein